MSLFRSFRTFIRIARQNPRSAWELSQLRLEKRLGVTLHWIDPLRRAVRRYEVANTEPLGPELIAVGNYYLDASRLSSHSTVFSIGIGEDIDFDKALIDKHLTKIHLFDPTPRSERFVAAANFPPSVRFDRMAILDRDGAIQLYIDDLENSFESTTSVSIIDRGFHSAGIQAPCRRISTLMKERGIECLDILKVDVEGAAIMIINDVLNNEILPTQIAAEFERPQRPSEVGPYLAEVDSLFLRLKNYGYRIYRTRPDCKGFQVEILAVRKGSATEETNRVGLST
jgi:FkbM family methyltransferase